MVQYLHIYKRGDEVMAKTDKEITSEIVCEFLRAWGTQSNCVPIKMDVLPELIKTTYNTVHSLEIPESDEE